MNLEICIKFVFNARYIYYIGTIYVLHNEAYFFNHFGGAVLSWVKCFGPDVFKQLLRDFSGAHPVSVSGKINKRIFNKKHTFSVTANLLYGDR